MLMPVYTAEDVLKTVPVDSGYDCALAKPVSSGRPLRLEARVVGPSVGLPLRAPFSGRECVYYAAQASSPQGMRSKVTMASKSASSRSFLVSLVDAPQVCLEVRGEDMTMFSVRGDGRMEEQRALEAAPKLWKDFVVEHRGEHCLSDGNRKQTHSRLNWSPSMLNGSVLEFREEAILIGAKVTLVGEVLRDAFGSLSMQPWTEGIVEGGVGERGVGTSRLAKAAREGVLMSDDPLLLGPTKNEQCGSSPAPSTWWAGVVAAACRGRCRSPLPGPLPKVNGRAVKGAAAMFAACPPTGAPPEFASARYPTRWHERADMYR